MKQDETRSKLIKGAIKVIARDGLDKASAKQIEQASGLNVVYIYRCFKDKEDLFAETFAYLDNEIVQKFMESFSAIKFSNLSRENKCRLLFAMLWRFLLGNQEKCVCFTRYFYSPYFKKYSADRHRADYEELINTISKAFKKEANVWMLFNHILNVMLDFAIKVYDGAIPDDDDTAEHVFRLVWFSINPYFEGSEVKIGENEAI